MSLSGLLGVLAGDPALAQALRLAGSPTSTAGFGRGRMRRKLDSTRGAGKNAPGESTAHDSTSVSSWTASVRPGAKGTCTAWPALLAACSTAAHPPRTM